jgi:hypothetical protein
MRKSKVVALVLAVASPASGHGVHESLLYFGIMGVGVSNSSPQSD